MGTFKFSMIMLKKEYKRSLFYGLTMLFATAMTFIFFHIINNEYLFSSETVAGGASWQEVNVPLSTILSFLIILFCCFMIFFANNFFVSKKTKEIAILTLSGSSFMKSICYLIYQTTALMLLAAPLGIGLGMLLAPYVNQYMYQSLQIKESIYYIPSGAIVQTVVLVVMLVIVLCVFAGGYIYRNEIKELLANESTMVFKDKRKLKLPLATYVILYLFGIVMMFMNEHSPIAYIAPSMIGVMGAIGLIRYVIPDWINKMKTKKWITNKETLIYMSNLNYSMYQAVILVVLMIGSVTAMVAVLASQQEAPREYTTALMGYFVIVILLTVSLVYKFCMEVASRKMFYNNMWKIGYTLKQITSIIKKEVFYFYACILCIPLVYVLFIAGRFIFYGQMTIAVCLMNIGIYVVPVLCSAIITYFIYKKTVLTPLQGGKNNGK